ncbi:cytidine deaminase [Ekhidna sp.]|uniref:cytidine deaminase n=1 Tax=Ekhidna sp. TaxID=2608089 RepID=UPI0032997F1D
MSETQLKDVAKKVAKQAYAPYSKFKVGCALLTKSGNVYTGCNVENASYGLTICAERNAIAQAINQEGNVEIETIVVYTPTPTPTPPCGACRQVIHEFGNPKVFSFCETDDFTSHQMSELLPNAFDLSKD